MIETVYAHLEFKAKNEKWSINLPFLCNKCGVCCTLDDFLIAGKIKTEPKNPHAQARAKALYKELGELWEVDPEKYEHHITHTPCPFLRGNICSIYEIRPDGCRQFPNTLFGMQTLDCDPLNRFKTQLATLKKGKATEKTLHFTTKPIKQAQFTEKQYQRCIVKLQKAGVTEEELALFHQINKRG
ncbi:MAG: YkgJ family cysteine cluster protein [Candidatus Bathyarchaeia archaeon]